MVDEQLRPAAGLSEDELEQEQAIELPDREAMSLIFPSGLAVPGAASYAILESRDTSIGDVKPPVETTS